MAYGLIVRNASGEVTLDTSYRTLRYKAFFSGNVTFGSPVTLTVTDLTNDGTWGYNNSTDVMWDVKTTFNTGSITVTARSSGTHPYRILVFKDG
tara:strand:+ start:63 stop:344 length:282 start_codon:yes stop_codon:yes gene_type:complete